MVQLIRQIQGEILTNVNSDIKYVLNVTSKVQQEDYINLNGLNGYLQNLTKCEHTYLLLNPINMGLKKLNNLESKTIEINY